MTFTSLVERTGDDGEIYQEGGTPPQQPKITLMNRVASSVRSMFLKVAAAPVSPAFSIGDRLMKS
jgi:hypothetical protein